MLERAMRMTDATYELDMEAVQKIAEEADNEESVIARLLIAAYDAGHSAGLAEAEIKQARNALLIACTGGHA